MSVAEAFARRLGPDAERILRAVLGEKVFEALTREDLGYDYVRRSKELGRSAKLLENDRLPDEVRWQEFRKHSDNIGMMIAELGALRDAE